MIVAVVWDNHWYVSLVNGRVAVGLLFEGYYSAYLGRSDITDSTIRVIDTSIRIQVTASDPSTVYPLV